MRCHAHAVAVVLALSLLQTSCSTISLQRRMADLAAAAAKTCRSDGSRCADASLCAHAALDASRAIQASRRATATGSPDTEATLRAATLPSLAEGLCLGFVAAKVKP
jgi:hypothetical protein